jgi:protein-L-isoaspartate O-methyltransferase
MGDHITYTATYSPDDNKLRLYASARLPADIYERVRAAGFIWAPKQDLFVAPMWTPTREDLLIELAGEIDDEDTSLVARAEERAERFDDYSGKRAADADRAHDAVAAIADNIPLGQPILVGHHSERHARKDAEKIENGMRRAVKMWETSKYWEQRAAGALAHAKYKELPRVRANRIKGLIADIRRCKAAYTPCDKRVVMQQAWNGTADSPAVPHVLCGQGRAKHFVPADRLAAIEAGYARWVQHYEFRLTYEKAMLAEQGASGLLEPKARAKQLPLCNYRAKSITCKNVYYEHETVTYEQIEMTAAEWAKICSDYKGCRVCEGSHRIRTCMRQSKLFCVFITDAKTHKKPAPVAPDAPVAKPVREYTYAKPEPTKFDALKDALKAGVKVVSAPQLFPTPADVARQVVELADIQPGHSVLEPSAGTGNLLNAMPNVRPGGFVVAVEINYTLAESLRPLADDVRCSDFLSLNGDLGTFDRIVMNPPFANAQDIKHIEHARHMLKPGGRLVAICAAGPRQREAFADAEWIDLPAGTFSDAGTNVNTAIVVIDA